MSRFSALCSGILLLSCTAPLAVPAEWDLSGAARIAQSLEKLRNTGSVLMIAAHPDDENNYVLAYLSRGRRLRTAYLSATRGEGGQNLIGPEQGDLLGIIRTQELLAARRVDGGEQFFTRAIDFGFSKSGKEALDKWGRDEILSDIVWVIRQFRPDVLVMTFSATQRDGHGQHTASAILGREAFTAAGDPSRFPGQLRWVKPWSPRRAVQSLYGARAAEATGKRLQIDPGQYDPVLGRSYAEIGGISRSMHRCQAEGSPERRGELAAFLLPVAGDPPGRDLMDGIDLTWKRLRGGEAVDRLLAEAAAAFDAARPERMAPALAKARQLAAAIDDPLARIKLPEFDELIALCSGLWIDAQAARYEAVPGSSLAVTVSLLDRSDVAVRVQSLALEGMWNEALRAPAGELPRNRVERVEFQGKVPDNQPFTQPYWLGAPHSADRYQVSDARLIGLAENPPVARVRARLLVAGATIELLRPVHHRYVDRALGERTRPLSIVPPVAVSLPQEVALFPAAGKKRIQAAVRANVADASGEARLELPAGWKSEPAARPFRIAAAGQQQDLWFDVTPPPAAANGRVKAAATIGAAAVRAGVQTISYPHFPPQTLFPEAASKLARSDIRVGARKVGYVMGAGDQMPEAIRQLGCEVTLLERSDLEQRNLAGFDAIVAGVRAYNVRADLVANQPRLMDYVRNGGTYIVQYQRLEGVLPQMGPFPYTVSHDRVTLEDAPVDFRDPKHPLLTQPNTISAKDFEGWIQERGLYFASHWDPKYETVLMSHDPGEAPLGGGLLYTPYGKGVYLYTGYAWFRQLPAGVTGAYRIFANLLSAKQR
jgi:LmbE family N-acetylglucosaminyl deacetylase